MKDVDNLWDQHKTGLRRATRDISWNGYRLHLDAIDTDTDIVSQYCFLIITVIDTFLYNLMQKTKICENTLKMLSSFIIIELHSSLQTCKQTEEDA